MRFRTFHGRTRAPVAIAIAIAMFLGACSKSEPETKPSRGVITAPTPPSAPPAPVAQPAEKGDAAAGASGYAPGEALKERLARQEAASKLMASPAPAPPRSPEVKAAPAKTPEPIKTSAPVKAPPPTPTKTEPVKATAPTIADVAMSAPAPAKSEPVKVEAALPPRTEVALAKPTAAAPAPAMRLVNRVEPDFPSEAVKAGVYEGTVQARLIVDANGSVTRVEIVEARPRRVFDRAVVRALSEWKYNEGAAGRTVTVELAFKAR